MRRILVLLLALSFACGLYPSMKTVDRLRDRVQKTLKLPQDKFAIPVIMHDGGSKTVVDGNGTVAIHLQRDYTYMMLVHEICHAVQWHHRQEFNERECMWVATTFELQRRRSFKSRIN
jgi:predicted metal-dependent hydrolase